VRLFSTEDDSIQFYKAFSRQEGRILSISWHKNDKDIFTGASDGTIRRWNTETGQCILTITVENLGRSEPTLVWSVYVLSDFTVVSGNSMGQTQFWDGKFGVPLSTFQEHTADVLTVVANEDESRVYASGVDCKVQEYAWISSHHDSNWTKTSHVRQHSHDVRSLSFCKGLLASGGVDTRLILYRFRDTFASSVCVKVNPFPQSPIFSLAPKNRLLLWQDYRMLHLWKLGGAQPVPISKIESMLSGDKFKMTEGHTLLLQLTPKLNNITCSALSKDGALVACSDNNMLKLFKLTYEEDSVKVEKCSIPSHVSAHRMLFTPDSQNLIIATFDFKIVVLDVSKPTIARVKITFNHQSDEDMDASNTFGKAPICNIAVSKDGKYLASGSTDNIIHIWDLSKNRLEVTLPIFDIPHTTFSFVPKGDHLVVACVNNHIQFFNINKKQLSQNARQYSDKISAMMEPNLYPIAYICFNPAFPNQMYLFAVKMGCWVILELELTPDFGPLSFALIPKSHFKNILFAEFMDANTLTIVERPWMLVNEKLPKTLERKQYAT